MTKEERRRAALRAWETIRVKRARLMDYEEWQREELAKEKRAFRKDLVQKILWAGGVKDRDFGKDVPLFLRRKTGLGLDVIALYVRDLGLWVEDGEALLRLIKESA